MQKCVNLQKKCPSREVVGFSEFRGEDLTRGKNSGGLRPPLELCFVPGQHRSFMQTLGSTAEVTDENSPATHTAEHDIRTKVSIICIYFLL